MGFVVAFAIVLLLNTIGVDGDLVYNQNFNVPSPLTQLSVPFDLYIFAQSWQAEFCHSREGMPGCLLPLPYWKSHFTVHGLWVSHHNINKCQYDLVV